MILIGVAIKSSGDSGVVGGPVAEQLLSCLLKGRVETGICVSVAKCDDCVDTGIVVLM